MPWLAGPLREALASQRGHALLVQGSPGIGQFDFANSLAKAWLCEAADDVAKKPCGVCAGCRLVQARSHPDLMVLVPEAMRESLGWVGDDGADEGNTARGEGSSKRKPSKEIRVEEVRRIVVFAQTTASRGRGKVVVIHPSERMNAIAANTLLKTLEEPAGHLRFVLTGSSVDALLPTLRSRCQVVRLELPDTDEAANWLSSQGVEQAAVLLAAAGGQPEDALVWAREGLDARSWLSIPAQVVRGEVGALAAWPLARVVDALMKLCHDAMRVDVGAAPRYFPATALARGASAERLVPFQRELQRVARHAEHPWQATLTIESLVLQAREAWAVTPPTAQPARRSVH